MTLLVGSCDL